MALLTATSALANSDSLKPEFVNMLLKPYFELQASLAGDDFKATKQHASAFNAMLGHGPSRKDAPALASLEAEAQKIVNASDIKTAREAFQAISTNLISLLEQVGTSGDQAYKMHCPMAFGNKGGTWLQNNAELRNPYFGSMMLHCGMQQSVIGKAE